MQEKLFEIMRINLDYHEHGNENVNKFVIDEKRKYKIKAFKSSNIKAF